MTARRVMSRGGQVPAAGIDGPTATGLTAAGLTVTGLTVTGMAVTGPLAGGPPAGGLMAGLTRAVVRTGRRAAALSADTATTAGPSSPRDRRPTPVRRIRMTARSDSMTATSASDPGRVLWRTRQVGVRPPMRAPPALNVDPVTKARPVLARPPVPGLGRRPRRIVGYGQSSRRRVRLAMCSSVGRIRGWGATRSATAKTGGSQRTTRAVSTPSAVPFETTGVDRSGIWAGSGSNRTGRFRTSVDRSLSTPTGSALGPEWIPIETWPRTPSLSGPGQLDLSHRARASITPTATIS
jgi:hypothetical protein